MRGELEQSLLLQNLLGANRVGPECNFFYRKIFFCLKICRNNFYQCVYKNFSPRTYTFCVMTKKAKNWSFSGADFYLGSILGHFGTKFSGQSEKIPKSGTNGDTFSELTHYGQTAGDMIKSDNTDFVGNIFVDFSRFFLFR